MATSISQTVSNLLVHHERHLTPDQVAFLRSPEGREAAQRADSDDVAASRVMCAQLRQVALSPVQTPDFHATHAVADGRLTVMPVFHGVVSLVTHVSVPCDHPAADDLLDALRANCASRMFRAADLHLRARNVEQKFNWGAATRRYGLYKAYLAANPKPQEISLAAHYEVALQHADSILHPRAAQLRRRTKDLADAAAPTAHLGWIQLSASFLDEGLRAVWEKDCLTEIQNEPPAGMRATQRG